MTSPLMLLGLVAGLVGAALCAVAGIGRLTGMYYLAGYENATLLLAGSSLMVFACMVRLYLPNNK